METRYATTRHTRQHDNAICDIRGIRGIRRIRDNAICDIRGIRGIRGIRDIRDNSITR